jgi:hypothetical protein
MRRLLMLPSNYKTVLMLTAVVIVVVIAVGLLLDPGPPTPLPGR